jgi:tetratricopeptide (TPR) repeat protein
MVKISIALIIILGFAVYANSLNGKFLYDDDGLVENNTFIKKWPVSPKVFTADFETSGYVKSPFYRPLQMITYAIDYRVWKLNVVGYHLTSMLLHILAALSIYWLISILFKDNILSALAAIFFVVHPVHTGVVSYISSRADSLYLLFTLVSFIFYIRSSKAKGVIYYLIMVLSYSLALLSKENALILPALLLLYHYTFKEMIRSREFLSMLGITLVYISDSTLLHRIPGFFAAVATYIRLMVLPFGLHMEYGTPLFSFTDPKAICGLGILAGLIFAAFKTIKTNRLIFFSLSWFLITILPVSNLYPINAYMAENWLYLPSIGFFLILAGYLTAFYKKEKYRILAMTITACLLAFYSYLTIKQNETWREPIPFYERTLKYAPDSSRICNNLANRYDKTGRKEEAIAMYKKAIEINSSCAPAYNNLGVEFFTAGRKEEAIAMYNKAIEINPDYADAYANLGNACLALGRKEEAIAMYKKAIMIDPNYTPAYRSLGLAWHEMGNKEEAIAMYEKAIELNPNFADAYNNLGVEYFAVGRKEEAIAMYKKAIELNPNYALAYGNLANRYDKMGRKEEAIAMYKKAIEINPDYAVAYSNLGLTYHGMGKNEEAITMYKKAIEVNPNYADAYCNLGLIYYGAGKKEEAAAMYKKAIEINPDYDDAYSNLGVAYFAAGRKEEAITVFKRALEINPAQTAARRNLDVINGTRRE